jgi:hypothetical protein
MGTDGPMVCPFLPFDVLYAIGRIDLKDKRSPVPAVLADINGPDISPDFREDLLALAFRAVEHNKELFMVHPLQILVQ